MNKNLMLVTFGLSLSACSTPDPGSFRTGDIDYETLKGKEHAAFSETRIYTKTAQYCSSIPGGQETVAPLLLPVLGFVVKESIAYGKDYLTKQAEYLSSDVSLNSNAFIYTETLAPWPSPTTLDDYRAEKDAKVSLAKQQAALQAAATAQTNESRTAMIKSAGEQAGSAYDNGSRSLKASKDDLCILIVAGEYKTGSDGNKTLNRFAQFSNALTEQINDYKMPSVGVESNGYQRPFQNLSKDPSLVIELQVTPTAIKDKIVYTVRPLNIFYPNPLHKGTLNGPERKLSIDITFDKDAKTSLALDSIKSGSIYDQADMINKFSMFEGTKDQRFQSLSVKIIEGPDKMPTAKVLNELASHDSDLQKYILDRLDSLAEKDGDAEGKK